MALSGTWKRTSTEGAEGFLKLFTQDEGKLARAAKTDLVSEITDSGNTVVIKRTWIGLPMYKSILMILEVFPIFISYPPNSTLEIPKIALKNFFGAI